MLKKFSFFHLGFICFGAYFALENWNALPFSLSKSMIFPVIMVLFGLSLLVDALKKPRKPRIQINHSEETKKHLEYHEDGFYYSASFGEHNQHISLDRLASATISTSFGDYTLDLSDVKEVAPNCKIEAVCSFGELTICVPSQFEVKQVSAGAFSDTSINGNADEDPMGIIQLEANVSFGAIKVEYI